MAIHLDATVNFRATRAEKAEIRAEAACRGTTASEMCRSLVLADVRDKGARGRAVALVDAIKEATREG